MDGLALYLLNRLPTKVVEKKRKLSPQLVAPTIETGVDYFCFRCRTHTTVTSTSIIQCSSCDYRILEKKRKDIVRINAV